MHYFAKKSIDGLRLLPTYCVEAYIQEKEVEITSSKVNKNFQMT